MPMNQDCKHFQSRTYPTGDTMRKCVLDLAPEAPWKCPTDCKSYQKRTADVGWRYGSLVPPETPEEPESIGEDDSIGALLDEVESIVNNVGPEIKSEFIPTKKTKKERLMSWFAKLRR